MPPPNPLHDWEKIQRRLAILPPSSRPPVAIVTGVVFRRPGSSLSAPTSDASDCGPKPAAGAIKNPSQAEYGSP